MNPKLLSIAQPIALIGSLKMRHLAIGALLVAALPIVAEKAAAQEDPRPATEAQVPSFDIWCLELQLYPAARCESRNSDDMQAYEHYRALAEQFAQQKAANERHDQELMDLLNRDPFDIKH